MSNYSFSLDKYNVKKHMENYEVVEKINNILKDKNLSTNQFIDIINSLADFLQTNLCYSHIAQFNNVTDKVVEVIEEFNTSNSCTGETKEKLSNAIEKFYKFIKEEFEVNIFFHGKDKYRILECSTKGNISIIEDMNKYIDNYDENNFLKLNVLIISEETAKCEFNLKKYFCDIIYYDQLMNQLFDISEKLYYMNYDYSYLEQALGKSKESDVKTIVVGNSYPLTGILEKQLKTKTVNLSLSSQDLFYSYKLARLVIENNKSIKRCIIGAGYYLVNHDLSLSQNPDSITRVKNVYYPLLREKHNAKQVEEIQVLHINDLLKDRAVEEIFNLNFLEKYFKELIYKRDNSYFNSNITREMNSMLRGAKLRSISEEEKWYLGEFRANQHNKLSKYTDTKHEYNYIFNDFIDFLVRKNIEPVIVIFPTTKYYNKFLNKDYEEEFYKIIQSINEKNWVKIVDLSKEDIFNEDDFIDFDHMSEVGALKITNYLNKRLKTIY